MVYLISYNIHIIFFFVITLERLGMLSWCVCGRSSNQEAMIYDFIDGGAGYFLPEGDHL